MKTDIVEILIIVVMFVLIVVNPYLTYNKGHKKGYEKGAQDVFAGRVICTELEGKIFCNKKQAKQND